MIGAVLLTALAVFLFDPELIGRRLARIAAEYRRAATCLKRGKG